MRRALQRLAVGRKSAATPSAALQAVADARRMQGVEPHREHVLTKVILHGGE
ncbi:MAG TPA: hypothetical protein VKB51_17530 [bacterium]|nr:hypothetical protein [bacterium]